MYPNPESYAVGVSVNVEGSNIGMEIIMHRTIMMTR